MVQAVNAKAIWTLTAVIRKPSLLVPHLSVATISDINYDALYSSGIRGILLDKDNTLTAPYVDEIHPKAQMGLEKAISVFGREGVAILSNSAGTLDDYNYRNAERIEKLLNVAVIRHSEKKPGGLSQVLHHFQCTDPARLCMVKTMLKIIGPRKYYDQSKTNVFTEIGLLDGVYELVRSNTSTT